MERKPNSAGILFCGDVHGHFDHLLDAARRFRPRALVLLGDLEAPAPLEALARRLEALGSELWFIPGNHDTDCPQSWAHLDASGHRNLHGRVARVAGVAIAGLGGVFRGEVWDPARPPAFDDYAAYCARERARCLPEAVRLGRELKHRSTIFPDVYRRLLRARASILITHEAPGCHPHGFAAIDELARALGVVSLFHGHHHDRLDYSAQEAGLGFRAFGVGFCGITDAEGRVLRPGEFDALRAGRGRRES